MVLEAASVKDSDLGAFLRQRGLTETDLAAWRTLAQEAAVAALGSGQRRSNVATGAESRRLKEMEQKLARAERRLSGANALLDLQKKYRNSGGPRNRPQPRAKTHDLSAHPTSGQCAR